MVQEVNPKTTLVEIQSNRHQLDTKNRTQMEAHWSKADCASYQIASLFQIPFLPTLGKLELSCLNIFLLLTNEGNGC